VVVTAEVIAAVAAPTAVLEVVATDAPHSGVVAVALQQRGAIGKEGGMGHTVILQDDALFYLLEEPSDGPAHAETAALVGVGIEPLDVTGPVDFILDDFSGGGHLCSFTGALEVGAVAGHV